MRKTRRHRCRRGSRGGPTARPSTRAPSVVESTTAPAASVGPSTPSVPTLASAAAPGSEASERDAPQARIPGCARRGRCPVTRTVVSPLEIDTERTPALAARRRSRRDARRAAVARLADHRRRRRRRRDSRARRASAAAPAIASRRPPMTRAAARCSRGSPGFGVSGTLAARPRARDASTTGRGIRVAPPNRSSTSSASANVRRIGNGRPRSDDAQVVADDIGDRERRATRAAVAAASRPPLMADRCLRTVLSA